jgi:hypothetical protein
MIQRLLLADTPTDGISTTCNWLVSTENHFSVIIQRETCVCLSIFEKTCLLIHCLAMDVLLFRVYASANVFPESLLSNVAISMSNI